VSVVTEEGVPRTVRAPERLSAKGPSEHETTPEGTQRERPDASAGTAPLWQ
jgi:hypothetical protein